MKQTIRLNENELKTFIGECVKRIIGKRKSKRVKIHEVKYFHPTGKTMPNGSHYTRGGFLHECYLNSNAFTLDEGVHPEQYGLAKYRGGMIVFSTDINAITLDERPFINKIKQFLETFKQRLIKLAMVRRISIQELTKRTNSISPLNSSMKPVFVSIRLSMKPKFSYQNIDRILTVL